jgi:hypothetical protein
LDGEGPPLLNWMDGLLSADRALIRQDVGHLTKEAAGKGRAACFRSVVCATLRRTFLRAGATLAVNRLDRRPRRRFSDRVHPFFGAVALIAGLASLWLIVGFFWAFLVFYGIFIAALVLLTI